MCVWSHCPDETLKCVQVSPVLLMVWAYAEEVWGSPPSLFYPLCLTMLNNSMFVISHHKTFIQKAFCSLSMGSAVNFSQACWITMLILEHRLVCLRPSPWWCITHGTVDSDNVASAALGSWQACALVVPGLFLTNFLSAECQFVSSSRPWESAYTSW